MRRKLKLLFLLFYIFVYIGLTPPAHPEANLLVLICFCVERGFHLLLDESNYVVSVGAQHFDVALFILRGSAQRAIAKRSQSKSLGSDLFLR